MEKYKTTTKDNKCIFCEIVVGNIKTPGFFWDDKEFMAWLAIDPNTKGFTCVIPKKHFGSDVFKMPDDILQRFDVESSARSPNEIIFAVCRKSFHACAQDVPPQLDLPC